jgi:3-oxoacyl-[acyl-carrier-protein] synthase III
MNAEPVFLNGIELMLAGLRSAAASIDVQPDQRVVVVPHQPSGKLLKALLAAARVEFPGFEYLNNLKLFGNTISSSVPTVLARLPEVLDANHYAPLRDGDHVILLAAGICMEEIGDHMSSGHACLQWVTNSVADDLSESDAPPVQEVVPVA